MRFALVVQKKLMLQEKQQAAVVWNKHPRARVFHQIGGREATRWRMKQWNVVLRRLNVFELESRRAAG